EGEVDSTITEEESNDAQVANGSANGSNELHESPGQSFSIIEANSSRVFAEISSVQNTPTTTPSISKVPLRTMSQSTPKEADSTLNPGSCRSNKENF
ncbi:hypothetical protein Bhyg_03525, partial [Pseudolycoriella hygida]